MAESYEENVRSYYDKMRVKFITTLMTKYRSSKIRTEDAENIYQDIFLAIHDNLDQGRIRENTAWSSYIMTVGMNMASKQYRKIGKTDSAEEVAEDQEERQSAISNRIQEILKELPEEEPTLYADQEVNSVLSDELTHTPEPCASIIHLTYYSGLSDTEITEQLDRYNSTPSVKAKRWQCMKDLIYRVKRALYVAGIIDEKPEKRK